MSLTGSRVPTAGRTIVVGFVATRLVLCAIGLLAVTRLPTNLVEQTTNLHLPPQPFAALEAWARYDACWYVAIAERSFSAPIEPSYFVTTSNFFPLFPELISLLRPIVRNSVFAGMIVSNACLLIFLSVVWKLVEADWNAEVAKRTIWIYLLFPSSFFLSGVYAESVMLAAVAGAVLMARRGHWPLSGILAAVATLARPIGIVAVVPVIVEYAMSRKSGRSRPLMLLSIFAPLVLTAAGYLLFAARTYGDPLAVFHSQTLSRGPINAPWRVFVDFWQAGPRLHGYGNSIFDFTLAVAALVTLPWIFTRVRSSYACYALFVTLIPLSGALISFNRLLLASFPHAILLARFADRRWIVLLVFIVFGILSAILMVRFATWNWVA